MKYIFGFFLVFIIACNYRKQTAKIASNLYGFDTTFEISKRHNPFMLTGYFNQDEILDTAILIKQKKNGKDALFIKHGRTREFLLLKNSKDLKTNFDNFSWVGQFKVIKKGTKIWNNVINGEIVSENQVPDNEKIILQTDGILVHEYERCGGGIIYFKNGKYTWMQQE